MSPAYDGNPEPFNKGLTLNITENDYSLNAEVATEVFIFFSLMEKEAQVIIDEIINIVSQWRDIAISLQISGEEQELMAAL